MTGKLPEATDQEIRWLEIQDAEFTRMTAEIAAILREPFDAKHIGKLPRVWCKACRDAQFKVCQQHSKAKCRDCGNNITTAHLHLDYVGHAEITDRLLHADPTWTWEPVAFGPDGLPLRDQMGGLWIRLTVAGVTRLGYGHADGKTGPDAVKEAIGDALRNAAMRFGVALDLWGATFKDGQHDDSEPEHEQRPDPEKVRQNILANARTAIAEARPEGLRPVQDRIGLYVERGSITADDQADLMKLIAARISEFEADRTAEPAAEPGQQPMGGDWPEPAKPGNPT